MEAMERKLYRAKEFAERAGVSVRTLHFYDACGLLEPAARTQAGYRLYGQAELERLEQVLALRFVGFELDRIKRLLQEPERPIGDALCLQRAMIVQQKRQLDRALAALDEAEEALRANASADRWGVLCNVIEVLKMRQDWSWTDNYYTDEDRAKLAQLRRDTPQATIDAAQRDWAELIAEVEAAAATMDPKSEVAKALVARWRALIESFTGGDPDIESGLRKLYSDPTHHPAGFKRPWSDAAEAFLRACKG